MDHVNCAHSPLELSVDSALPPILFDELVFEILSWLPVKSLVRFSCVCKYWKSIISNPKFIKDHLLKSRKSSDLLLMLGRTRDYTLKFSYLCSVRSSLKSPSSFIITEDFSYPLDLDTSYHCVGTCNGLVCLVKALSFPDHYNEICVCFWNPATRQISETSTCLSDDLGRYPIFPPLFGFGYDNLNDTYKVVTVIQVAEEEDAVVKVYSLDDKCWRNIQNFPIVGDIACECNNGVYLNGTLNWLEISISNSIQSQNRLSFLIVSLDLGKDTYMQLLSPHLGGIFPIYPALGVLMDCLCLFYDDKRTHFVVWQMTEFGVQNSWNQLLKVSYQDTPIFGEGFTSLADMSLVRMYKNGDILITMDATCRLQAILYNQRDNKMESVKTLCSTYEWWPHVMGYVESLISPS